MYIYVNQKTIEDKVYTALRDDKNPRKEAVECDGEIKECRLKEVWNFNNKILQLWQ
jgi:hypothetical protein